MILVEKPNPLEFTHNTSRNNFKIHIRESLAFVPVSCYDITSVGGDELNTSYLLNDIGRNILVIAASTGKTFTYVYVYVLYVHHRTAVV